MRCLMIVMAMALAGAVFAQQGWRLENPNASWMPRGFHGTFVINNEVWIFSGRSASGTPQPEDGWSSSNGVNWNLQYSYSAPPNPLLWNGTLVLKFNGKVWVLGGGGTSRVVHSPDGVNWTQEPDAPWLGRGHFAGVVFNGKMWIFGGYDGSYLFNDVWSTTDGVNWTQEVAAAAWSHRADFEAVVFNNRVWIMGGSDGTQFTNDVWSSADGINWVQETADAGWEGRWAFQSVVYRDRIWVLGGDYSIQQPGNIAIGRFDDVWSSADGVTWVKETDNAPWGERARHGATVFNGRIWLTGGSTLSDGYFNDVWSYGLHFTPEGLPDPVAGEPYSADFEAYEGDGPFSWSLVSGQLPPGLTLNTSTTSDTLTLEGTPETQQITYTFTIRLEDKDGYTIEQEYTITVTSPPPPSGGDSGGNSGCTARSTGSGQARSAGLSTGGLAWLILTAATLAAILRRRDHRAGVCE